MALSKTASIEKETSVVSIIAPEKQVEVNMGFNSAVIKHLIDRLTDMYPRPVLSSVREVVSNAIDATVLMPVEDRRPVEIETPTALNPTFVVRDYGVGMSVDDITNVYSQYGGSTKGDDYRQIGAYGLGAKAPLAYCNEFQVATTKDGITTNFLVSRKSEGNVTTIVSSEYTGAPSGTRVSIPAQTSDTHKFDEALKNYRVLQTDISLVIDGELVKNSDEWILFDTITLDEDTNTTGRVWVSKDYVTETFPYLMMTGYFSRRFDSQISYILSGWVYRPYNQNFSNSQIIVEIKPGVLDFSSSRDDITQNDRFNSLNEKIKQLYFNSNANLVDKFFEIYKSFNTKDAFDFYQSVSAGATKDGVVFDTTKAYRHSLDNPGVKVVISKERFTTDEGINPFEVIKSNGNDSIFGIVNMTGEKGKNYSFFYKDKLDNWTTSVGLYNTISTTISDAVTNDSKSSFLQSVYQKHYALSRTARKSARYNFIVITSVDKSFVKEFVKSRLIFARDVFPESFIILAKKDVPDSEFALVQDFMTTSTFTKITSEEALTKLEEAKVAKRKEHRVAKVEHSVSSTQYGEKIKNLKEFFIESKRGDLKTSSIKELCDDKNIIVIISSFDKVPDTLRGISNAGVKLKGKTVRFIDPIYLSAPHYNLFEKYDNVWVNKDVTYNCKSFRSIYSSRAASAAVLKEELSDVSLKDSISVYISDLGLNIYPSNKVFMSIADKIEDSNIKKALTVLASYENNSSYSIYYSLVRKYNGMGAELMAKHLKSDELVTLEKVVKSVNLLTYNGHYNDFKSTIYTGLFNYTEQFTDAMYEVSVNDFKDSIISTIEMIESEEKLNKVA